MLRTMMKSKVHRATVTQADLLLRGDALAAGVVAR
jgi:aspartate 1-decarboxylase